MFNPLFKYCFLLIVFYFIGAVNISHADETQAPAAADTSAADDTQPAADETQAPAAADTSAADDTQPAADETQAPAAADTSAADEKQTTPAYQPCKPIKNEDIAALQFEVTGTKEKVSILDKLSQMDSESLKKCFYTSSDKELVGLTIIELSRHTNSELAQKAQSLRTRLDLVPYIEEIIKKDEGVKAAGALLLRIEAEQVKELLDKISASDKKTDLLNSLSDKTPALLIPTASDEGDLYYVKVNWDTKDEKQMTCLTELFNNELDTERSLDQEKEKMQQLNGRRLVYSQSKEWSLSIAESILSCGGKAEFVNGNKY